MEQKEETFGIKIKKSDTFSKKNNYEGLFILGVLESAAKEKKRRKTIQNKKLNKYDEDEKWIIMKILVYVYIYFWIIYLYKEWLFS